MRKPSFLLLKKNIILALISFMVLTSCNMDEGYTSCLPRMEVNAVYSLLMPYFAPLNSPMGYVVLPSDGTNGTQGMIIINTGNGFRAYDRNAPHLCPDTNTVLIVEDDLKIVCPADGAEWLLLTGEPLNNQTQGRTPLRYRVTQQDNNLQITW
ncbi:MAG: hypothetical protein Q4F57_04960 [Weeksellaceae bacterium]|nr:hypothetical protein [Weeksellaceae bacterium]